MKYEYGFEYATRGVKPNLPSDDIEVCITWVGGLETVGPIGGFDIDWHNTVAIEIVDERYKQKTSDASASIANLLNAQAFIAAARKASEFSEHNVELADQADAILQAIIGNLKAERIPVEASFHLANAQNELNACTRLLEGDKKLADAVFCISEKLAGIRKGEL